MILVRASVEVKEQSVAGQGREEMTAPPMKTHHTYPPNSPQSRYSSAHCTDEKLRLGEEPEGPLSSSLNSSSEGTESCKRKPHFPPALHSSLTLEWGLGLCGPAPADPTL